MKRPELLKYWPLLLVTVISFAIKMYDPLRSPVLAALDPWGWTIQARQFLATHGLNPFFTQTGYPPTFLYFVAGIAQVFRADPYDVVRFLPILTALNVIPIYLLAMEIFHSHRISALGSLLAVTSRFYFMRTSIGIPEGLALLFFTFALLFLLKSFSIPSWRNRLLAIASMAISVLYYHFTFIILIPILLILPLGLWSRKRIVVREIGSTALPAFIFAGLVWYLPVLPNMIQYYFGTKTAAYARPTIEHSAGGLIRLAAYTVAKSSVLAFAEMGYVITVLALVGIVYLVRDRTKENGSVGPRLLLTYLAVLVGLTLILRFVYDLGLSGAGDSSVYMFSWLTIPASIFAATAVMFSINQLSRILHSKFPTKNFTRATKVAVICAIILLVLVNLNALNYYKAPAGGAPIPDSFYYFKPLTNQEYYAFAYIRDNTPIDAQILVVGVEHTILVDQAVVAQRAVLGITNMTIVNQTIEFSGQIVYPDNHYENITSGTIQENPPSGQQVYVVTGIRYVSTGIAIVKGTPPATVVMNERLLTEQLADSTAYQTFYENSQVTVAQVPLQIQY